MTTCERCWIDANRAALMLGGSVPDHYRRLLAERRDNPCMPEQAGDGSA